MAAGAPTPGIKRLAAEGMKLLNFKSRRSARRPRSALLTGRHAIRSGTHAVRIVAVRALALDWGWEALLAKEPAGVYQHPHGRPLLVRKLAGKSLRELGLTVEEDPGHVSPSLDPPERVTRFA